MLNFFLVILVFASVSSQLNAANFKVSIAVMGDHATGKTALIRRYFESRYRPQEVTMVGVDLHFGKRKIGDDAVTVAVWESPGITRFLNIFLPNLSQVEGVLYIYDATDRDSVHKLKVIKRVVDRYLGEKKMPVMLVAAKTDSAEKIVSFEEGDELARAMTAMFFEVSALTADNVNEAFDALLTKIIEEKKEGAQIEVNDKGLKSEVKQKPFSTKFLHTSSNNRRGSARFSKIQPTINDPFADGSFSIN